MIINDVSIMCPVHVQLYRTDKLERFANCVACIRVERDELRRVIKDLEIQKRLVNGSVQAINEAWVADTERMNRVLESIDTIIKTSQSTKDTYWLVESAHDGNVEGWWYAAPPEGVGGWRTQDPLQAKRYTKGQAEAVAQALTYFHLPFPDSQWVATEHLSIDPQKL